MSVSRCGRCGLAAILPFLVVLVSSTTCTGASPAELPPSLRALPMDVLLSLFSVSFESPNMAAEVARLRAWAPASDTKSEACSALADVIVRYPRTSDARRALLDICGVYAGMGEWDTAEAPFRYVMEARSGQPEARVARFRLAELYRYTGRRSYAILECRSGIEACAGTPEEGLGRALLADILAEQDDQREQAFTEFERVLHEHPGQPYSSYARIQYALALVDCRRYDRALEVIAPVLDDPVWGGRARCAEGKAYAGRQNADAAITALLLAARTADSVFIRGEAYAELARVYEARRDFNNAQECLGNCMGIAPLPGKELLDMNLQRLHLLCASGQYIKAAALAVELEMAVTNQRSRYSEREMDHAIRSCNSILDSCEKALCGRSDVPASAVGR